MIEPPPVLTESRVKVGWIVLAAVGIPILVLSFLSYLMAAYREDNRAQGCQSDLRTAVQMSRSNRQSASSLWENVDACIAKTGAETSMDRLAAMVKVAAAQERGEPVDPKSLNALADSRYERRRLFARVYAKKTMSRSEAEALVRALPDTAYVYRLAKVHAMGKAGVKGVKTRFLGPPRPPYAMLLSGLLMIGGTLLGIVVWVVYGAMRAGGFWKPKGHPLDPVGKPLADRCALDGALYLLLYVFASFSAMLFVFGPKDLSEPLSLVVQSSILTAGIVGITFLPFGGRRITFGDLGLKGKRLWEYLAWGVGGTVANVPIFLVAAAVGHRMFGGIPTVQHPVLSGTGDAGGLNLFLLFLGASVFAPFIEETWFRGKLLPAFSGITGKPVWGIVITSLLFAALHPTGLPSYLALASVGAMAAMLTYQTKSLIPALVLHALHNGAILLMTKLMA